MHALGILERLPRLLAVQAAHVMPLAYAMHHDRLPPPSTGTTIDDSIDVRVPRNWRKAVRAILDSHGELVGVGDNEILDAMRTAGRHGVFAEPAAAAALAGVVAAIDSKTIGPHDRVLVMITGSGLKDTRSAIRAGGRPIPIEADVEAVKEALLDSRKSASVQRA
jgi:threonine synthase